MKPIKIKTTYDLISYEAYHKKHPCVICGGYGEVNRDGKDLCLKCAKETSNGKK